MKTTLCFLLILITAQLIGISESFEVRNRFGLRGIGDFANSSEELQISWVPELSFSHFLGGQISLQGEYSLQGRTQHIWDETHTSADITAESYRYWLRLSSPKAELRAGLQRLNFGTARVLRPLQWFDRINPLDQNEETKGVQALLYRYYFVNNTNIWLWGILAENETKGNELLASRDESIEYGARIQYPLPQAETAISFHTREYDALPGLSGREYRMGIDLRTDAFIGFWLEGSASHFTKADALPFENLVSSTLGVDYTLGFGNGIYALLETNLTYFGTQELTSLQNQGATSALMLDYPLGLLDSIALLNIYDYKSQKSLHSLVYRRIYDHLSIEASLSHDLHRDFGGISSRSISIALNYNI